MGQVAEAIRTEVQRLDEIIKGIEDAQSAPKLVLAGKWFRFMFRIESPAEMGSFGKILCQIIIENMAVYIEPWPENDLALYIKDEGENRKEVMALAKQTGLIPISAKEVQ